MTYVIMIKTGKFPKSWHKICTIANLFNGYPFLYKQYGLKPEDTISVRLTMRNEKNETTGKLKMPYHWANYRSNWQHPYNGTVAGFAEFSKEKIKEIRRRKHGKKNTNRLQRGISEDA